MVADDSISSRRRTSGSFSQLNTSQIRKLKEAYYLIDNDGDGCISFSDLKAMLVSLGMNKINYLEISSITYKNLGSSCSDEYIKNMLAEMPRPLTFSSFLTMMSETLGKVTPASDLINAFMIFEEENSSLGNTGSNPYRIKVEELKDLLYKSGMKEGDINTCLNSFYKSGGLEGNWFYYGDFVSIISSSDNIDE